MTRPTRGPARARQGTGTTGPTSRVLTNRHHPSGAGDSSRDGPATVATANGIGSYPWRPGATSCRPN